MYNTGITCCQNIGLFGEKRQYLFITHSRDRCQSFSHFSKIDNANDSNYKSEYQDCVTTQLHVVGCDDIKKLSQLIKSWPSFIPNVEVDKNLNSPKRQH